MEQASPREHEAVNARVATDGSPRQSAESTSETTVADDRGGAALGPHAVQILDAESAHVSTREQRKYAKARIYVPEGFDDEGVDKSSGTGPDKLASVVIVPGFACGENVMSAWAFFWASHGFLVTTISALRPFHDMPRRRADAALDCVDALKAEGTRVDSTLFGRLDDRFAVAGWSLGGGGCHLAAVDDPSLKCILEFAPHSGLGLCFARLEPHDVPTLAIAGQCDVIAWPWVQRRFYDAARGPKLHLEVRGGDHAIAAGPAGGNCFQIAFAYGACALCTFGFGVCCGDYSPCGVLDRPAGTARPDSRRGAIGAIALRWLDAYLRGEAKGATRRAGLAKLRRPGIASVWQRENLDSTLVTEQPKGVAGDEQPTPEARAEDAG